MIGLPVFDLRRSDSNRQTNCRKNVRPLRSFPRNDRTHRSISPAIVIIIIILFSSNETKKHKSCPKIWHETADKQDKEKKLFTRFFILEWRLLRKRDASAPLLPTYLPYSFFVAYFCLQKKVVACFS